MPDHNLSKRAHYLNLLLACHPATVPPPCWRARYDVAVDLSPTLAVPVPPLPDGFPTPPPWPPTSTAET
ncbi:hypothetical protein, partial [Chitinivorax sp. B]|uniref:hypothetical protein n=1 Tax=Chitinivorax sp. B TaxID=2502235 RepID=UPI001BB18DA1